MTRSPLLPGEKNNHEFCLGPHPEEIEGVMHGLKLLDFPLFVSTTFHRKQLAGNFGENGAKKRLSGWKIFVCMFFLQKFSL